MSITNSMSMSSDRLIPSTRVAGTAVYDIRGERLGHIDDVMIDKPTGRIAYAVLSFGGFLGFGDKHHPMPWNSLRYDTALDGYVVDLDKDTLTKAPAYAVDQSENRDWEAVDTYYGSSAAPAAAEQSLESTSR